jgi:hypothetical protein
MRWLAGFLLAGVVSATPVIRDIQPKGAQRGKTVKLVVKGSDLPLGAKLETKLPANISRLAPSPNLMRPDSELPFLVELKSDAATGVYPLRIVSDDGISNVVLFSVSDLAEKEEFEAANPKQSNDLPQTAEKLAHPAVVTGTLTAADVDFYSFAAKAGERIVFEVEASAIGSAIDPAIEILDAAGKTLAKNDDGPGAGIDSRLEMTFAKAGAYFLRVHDAKYSDQAVNFYRLKAGSYPYAEALFPLGWKRGDAVSVELIGSNLSQPAAVRPDTNARGRYLQLNVPGSASLPMLFELTEEPHVLEPATAGPHMLTPGVILNGRIGAPKELDVYRLAVKPGEHWMIELRASRLGTSRLDALITVRDPAGKKIASRDDLAGADPVLPFEVPKDVTEVRIAVEDLLGRAGAAFGYQLLARRGPADFTLSLVTPYVNIPAGGAAEVNVTVQRRGYDGDLRLSISNLPKGFRQAGGHVATSAAQQRFDDPNPRFNAVRSTITISAEEDVPAQTMELAVVGVAETPAGRIERRADGPGFTVGVRGLRQKALTAPWLELELPAAVSKRVPARLVVKADHVRMAQGVEFPLEYQLERGMGVRLVGQIRQNVTSAVGNLRINRGIEPSVYGGAFLVNTNFATPAEKFDMLLDATVEAEGKQFTVTAPIVTFEIVHGYHIELDRKQFAAAAGRKFEIAGQVRREKTFEGGLVKIEVADVPDGIECAPADVPSSESSFRLACQAAPGVRAGESEIRIVSSAPDTGRKAKDTYKIPDIMAILRVEATAAAAR